MSTDPSSVTVDTKAATPPKAQDDVSPTSVSAFVDPKTMNEAAGRRLKSIVSGMTAPFCSGGTLQLKEPPTVQLTKEETIKVTIEPPLIDRKSKPSYGFDFNKEALKLQPEKLKALVDKAPPAVFGKGSETVYDTSVRSAKQLSAQDFQTNIPQEALQDVLEQIKVQLNIHTDITVEPYSLNIYEKGGKFAKHKDTPRGPDMIGTLLFCLPSLFRGGAMTVEMGTEQHSYFGNTQKYSWSDETTGLSQWWYGRYANKKDPDPKAVPWCAFFADIDHHVHEVTDGVRVTLAYLIRRKDGASATEIIPRAIHGTAQTTALVSSFSDLLLNTSFLPTGGKIGFPCEHLYTNQQVYPNKRCAEDVLSDKAIKNLKGRDMLVAQSAVQAGLNVYLVPIVGHEYSQDGQGDYVLDKFPKKKKIPRRMDDDRIESFFDSRRQEQPYEMANVWAVDVEEGASKGLGSCEWNAEGYFGNEASFIDFYVKAALLVEIPDVDDREHFQSNKKPKTK